MQLICPLNSNTLDKLNWIHILTKHIHIPELKLNMVDNLIEFINLAKQCFLDGLRSRKKIRDKIVFVKNFKTNLPIAITTFWNNIKSAFDKLHQILWLIPKAQQKTTNLEHPQIADELDPWATGCSRPPH